MATRRFSRGVSFVELIVVLAILGIIAVIAMPEFATMMANQRIRSSAESLRSGLQVARMEALKRGQGVVFDMSNLDSSWSAGCEIPVGDDNDGDGLPDCPSEIQAAASVAEGGTDSIAIVTDGGTQATFSALGLVRQLNQDGSAPFTQVDITVPNVSSSGIKPMRVLLPVGGLSRVCDPSVSTEGDTRKC